MINAIDYYRGSFNATYFGTIKDIATQIYDDLKKGIRNSWDIGGYSRTIYECDDDINDALDKGDTISKIRREFDGWCGCKILEDYPFDGNDLILIGDQYGGGFFSTAVLPEGIEHCESYESKEYWINDIANMICNIMDAYDGRGHAQLDSYVCMENGI